MYIHEASVHNKIAAEQVVPIVKKLFSPESVIDVGCGIGTWLTVFKQQGVQKIKGVDGDYVNRGQLFENIKEQEFVAHDLSKPFDFKERFDLLICLEVAEHLPPESARGFISSLCKHSDKILFGAAIPGQWGQNHLNEQWAEYWIELFKANDYFVNDAIRPLIWQNELIEWWYKQNILVFTKEPFTVKVSHPIYTSVIHPEHFNQKLNYIKQEAEINNTAKNELERWQMGKMGVRKHFATFLTSLKSKFFNF